MQGAWYMVQGARYMVVVKAPYPATCTLHPVTLNNNYNYNIKDI